MSEHAPLQRALYVVSQFPCLSETFIVREINTLIAQGVDVRILSLKPPSRDPIQRESAALLDRVMHPHLLRTLGGSLAAVARDPAKVLGSLATIMADSWRRPVVMAKSLVAVLRGLEHVAWLREFDPQLIHAHWATYPTTVAWVLGRVLDRPFGFTCHAHDIFIERQMLARKIDEAALAVTISHYNVDWLSHHATPNGRGQAQGRALRRRPGQEPVAAQRPFHRHDPGGGPARSDQGLRNPDRGTGTVAPARRPLPLPSDRFRPDGRRTAPVRPRLRRGRHDRLRRRADAGGRARLDELRHVVRVAFAGGRRTATAMASRWR